MSHDQSTTSPFRKVSTGTWADRKVMNLSRMEPSGQAMFVMLLIGPQTTNMPGVQPVGRLAFAEMLEWEPEAFDKAFADYNKIKNDAFDNWYEFFVILEN